VIPAAGKSRHKITACLLLITGVVSLAAGSACKAQTSGGGGAKGASQMGGSSVSTPQAPSLSSPLPSSISAGSSLGVVGGLGDGPIVAGDTVQVQVFDAPELSVNALVSQSGDIPVPLLEKFHIAGMTSIEAAHALERAFKDTAMLENPNIIVTVQQSSNGITVAGEVRSPGIYPIAGKHRLIDVLTRAGGPTDNAAHVIEISGPAPDNIQRVIWDPTFQENPAMHVQVEASQTVLVGRCGVVYLGGNLNKVGAYQICGSRHTTVSEAIALAGGTKPSTASSKTVLLRSEQGTRTIRTINLEDILRGKSPDFTMNSDDILYVPSSAFKASMKVIGQAAINFASVVAAYRLQ
jgi:polysaccharide biosynthesis/export protein